MINISINTREFDAAVREMYLTSKRTSSEVLTDQARRLLRKLAWRTPRYAGRKKSGRRERGRARAGWWPAWKALNMNGTPYIGNSALRNRAEGDIDDQSRAILAPHITVGNNVSYIEKLDDASDILGGAMNERVHARDGLEVTLEQRYAKMLKHHSG